MDWNKTTTVSLRRKKNAPHKSKSIEIYKRMLLSRNTEEQIKAVSSIYSLLHEYEKNRETYIRLIDWLLVNDTCVFLCEATATLQVHLLRLILRCFQRFSTNPSFYLKSHAPQVITSTIRTVQFLVKENGSEKVIDEMLCFVSHVIVTSKTYSQYPIVSRESLFNVLQIFELLSTILDKTSYETQTKISISTLLHNAIIRTPNDTVITTKTLALAKDVIEKNLNMLYQILVVSQYKCAVEKKLAQVFDLICDISLDSLHFSNNCVVIPMKNSEQITKNDEFYMNAIREVVCKILFEVTSEMQEFELFVLKPNFDVFLELLNEFLNQQKISQETLIFFAQHLSSHGFLAFLRQLASISSHTKKLCLMNLAEILSLLSIEVFHGNYNEKDYDSFKRFLYEGFVEVDFNHESWPQMLNDSHASNSAIHALIVYIYFSCLHCQSPEAILSPLLPYLVEFILMLPKKKNCPDHILKCIWLIFSIASLYTASHSEYESILLLQRANYVMSNMLTFRVKNVYTHHSHILLWSFSSYRISTVVKNQVLSLWFEKETVIPKELTSVSAMWSSLLEIIIMGENQTEINMAKDLLKECICEYPAQSDQIRHEIWNTLPKLLKHMSIEKNTNAQSALCLIELSNSCPPKVPDLSTVRDTVSLLPTLLLISKKCDISVEVHFIKEVYALLLNSLRHEDKFVLSQYMNSKVILQSVYNASLSGDIVISRVAYDILHLIMYYKVHFNIENPNCIKMDPSILLTSLRDENNSEKCISILTLIHQAIKLTKNNSDVFVILAPMKPVEMFLNTYRALFFRLQMICCKDIKNEALASWYTLSNILEFAAAHSDIPKFIWILTSQPWTHKLIHFFLYQNESAKCHKKFLTFVYNWLMCHKILHGKKVSQIKNGAKEIFQPYAESNVMFGTLGRIINKFNDNALQEVLPEEKKKMINSILNLVYENFM